ncbi:putative RiPP precursor [Ruminococcus albus]|nr:putative RiPP precursor [Ruminococcus albus]
MTYNKPSFEKISSFKESTMGVWFGKFKDIFGGKAVVEIVIYY